SPRPRRRHTARRPGGLLRGRAAARATRMRWVDMPAPGSAVALVGDPEPVAELGRWLAGRHAGGAGEPGRPRVPDLAGRGGAAGRYGPPSPLGSTSGPASRPWPRWTDPPPETRRPGRYRPGRHGLGRDLPGRDIPGRGRPGSVRPGRVRVGWVRQGRVRLERARQGR